MDFTHIQIGMDGIQSGVVSLDLINHVAVNGISLAQTFHDDLFSNVGQAWDKFIRTGQVWALIIGFVVGYIFRSVTAY